MAIYGALWHGGQVYVPRVKVVFNPHRWTGTLTYTGLPEVDTRRVYTLKLDDGDSADIGFWNINSNLEGGELQVSAVFNPVRPQPS